MQELVISQTVSWAAAISNYCYSLPRTFVAQLEPQHGFLYVAFRGSKTRGDWWSNCKIFCRRDHVHRGFLRAATEHTAEFIQSSEFHQLKTQNKAHPEKPMRLVLTGHSRGGAIALLVAKLLIETKQIPFEDVIVISFGAPRVGDKALARLMANLGVQHLRFYNGSDLVPRLPRRILGYRHYDTIGIGLHDEAGWLSVDRIEDHDMSRYARNVSAYFETQRKIAQLFGGKTL